MIQAQAFLSYTRTDDDYFGGNITALRKMLELGVRVVTGDPTFQIFQDVEGIELGQQWEKRIGDAIDAAHFLIPILTPLFFRSHPCRDEFSKFVDEKALDRDDLILPIYFVTVPWLEKASQQEADPLAVELNKRQRFDWRNWSDLPVTDSNVRKAIKDLAEKIAQALERTNTPADPSTKNHLDSQLEAVLESDTRKSVAPAKTKEILWVDDRPNNNFFERQAFSRYGIKFVLAMSTSEALKILSTNKFDAIISDMGRPPDPRAGYTLLEAVRKNGNKTPYFIYAGSRAPEHVAEGLRRGAQGTTNLADELIMMVLSSIGIQEKAE